MKSFLSFVVVAIVCLSVSGNATAQDCDSECDCQPVRSAVARVLEAPQKVMCAWKAHKPVRTMACKWKSCKPVRTTMCKWQKAKPVRSMFNRSGCGCN